jgi:hypothetical protein
MNAVERALRDFLAARPVDIAVAMVGGLAVSARAEPRFTRDLDFAVAVANDDEAAHYVFRIPQRSSSSSRGDFRAAAIFAPASPRFARSPMSDLEPW